MTDRAEYRWNSPKPNERPWAQARRITPEQAAEIRTRHDSGETYQELAQAYGVSARTIRRYAT